MRRAAELAGLLLHENGSFYCKVFQGEDFPAFAEECKPFFADIKIIKPQSSCVESREVFLCWGRGSGDRPPAIRDFPSRLEHLLYEISHPCRNWQLIITNPAHLANIRDSAENSGAFLNCFGYLWVDGLASGGFRSFAGDEEFGYQADKRIECQI